MSDETYFEQILKAFESAKSETLDLALPDTLDERGRMVAKTMSRTKSTILEFLAWKLEDGQYYYDTETGDLVFWTEDQ